MTIQLGNKDSEDGKEEKPESETIISGELLNAFPEPERGEFIRTITSISGIFPQQNPLARKFTSEHITTILQNADASDRRDREERMDERKHDFRVLISGIIALLLICGLFIWAKQTDILKYVVGAILGFAGGFGIGKRVQRKE